MTPQELKSLKIAREYMWNQAWGGNPTISIYGALHDQICDACHLIDRLIDQAEEDDEPA